MLHFDLWSVVADSVPTPKLSVCLLQNIPLIRFFFNIYTLILKHFAISSCSSMTCYPPLIYFAFKREALFTAGYRVHYQSEVEVETCVACSLTLSHKGLLPSCLESSAVTW